jgi:hypothetical protein
MITFCPTFPGNRDSFDERAEPVRELEYRAVARVFAAVVAAVSGGSVKSTIGGLKNGIQRSEAAPITTLAELVKRRECAFWSDSINGSLGGRSPRTRPAPSEGSIEIAVAGQRQFCLWNPYKSVGLEAIEYGVLTGRCDLEHNTAGVGAARIGRAHKIALGILRDRVGIRAVGAKPVLNAAEVVNHLIRAGSSQFVKQTAAQGPACACRTVKASVVALDRREDCVRAVSAVLDRAKRV